MIQTPKQHFQSNSALSKALLDVVMTETFQQALMAALLEYSMRCASEVIPDAAHWKAKGAFEFSRELCALSIPPRRSVTNDPDNLE